MKILTDKDTAELTIPAVQLDYKLFVLDGRMSTFDVFDRINPDLIIIKSSSLSSSVIKNILERPHLKIAVINDDQEKINELRSVAGNIFIEKEDSPFCNIMTYSGAKFDSLLKSDVLCLEGADIEDLNRFEFPRSVNYKIFSSKKFIHHNNFCGVLGERYKPSAIKSSKYCIVNKKMELNAIYAGSVPIADSNFISANDISVEEIKESKTNFHYLSNIFYELGLEKESKVLKERLENYL